MIEKDKFTRNILLIEPPFYRLFKHSYSLHRYPLGLGYLAATIIKETDWKVMIYNADFSPKNETKKIRYFTGKGSYHYMKNLTNLSCSIWEEVKSSICEFEPSVIGISCKTQNFISVSIIAKLAKNIDRKIIVIVGGPHPSSVGADVLNCSSIDIGVKGEGERTIVELLEAIETQKELKNIPGIVYRQDKNIIETKTRKFIEDLDSLTFPHEIASEVLKDYTQYPLSAFKNIFATRGCPFNCVFCGSHKIWSRKVRFRSTQSVAKEIKRMQEKGLNIIHFDDDTFGITKDYIHKLCNAIIQYNSGLRWSCELHVKLIDSETISIMKKAGCYSILLGIESGSNEILKKIKKNITIQEAYKACKIIKKHGIELHAFFMVGFPQETKDTLHETYKAMKKIKCDQLAYSIFTPYPGTEAYKECEEYGLISKEYKSELYHHQSPINCFCIHLCRSEFRTLVSKIENMVDRRNRINRVKRIFSINLVWRIKQNGIKNSIKEGLKIIAGK